jgi:hypothetical protein
VGDVLGADGAALPGAFHLGAAEAEEVGFGEGGDQGGDELRAVEVAACLAGGEKDARVGGYGDGLILERVL